MFAFLNDLRYGVRLLLKAPAFALVAIAALAIGVGANITIFGFASELLLRPLDVTEPDRLVRGYGDIKDPVAVIDYSDYEQYRDRNSSLASLALFHWGGLRPVRAESGTEMLHVMPVTGNYFSTLGVAAAMGRAITPQDDAPGAPAVVALSDVCWRRHFHADPGVVGRTIFIKRIPVTIIGVLPASFNKGAIGGPVVPQFYLPWNLLLGRAGAGQLIGRLRPGVSRQAAQADLARVAAQLTAEHNRRTTIALYPATTMAPSFRGTMALFAVMFMAVVGLVLLICCDNIAILLLARTAARRREIAIRLALGASRAQLVRQLLAEDLLLSLLGGAGACAFAFVTARWLSQIYLPVPMPIALTFDFDWRVSLFAAALSLGATLLFGLGPALQAVKAEVVSALKEGGSGAAASGGRMRFALVVAQVAMSSALLVTAVTLVRTLTAPQASARGFNTDHVLMAQLNLPSGDYTPAQALAFYQKLQQELERTAGVLAVSLADNIPASNIKPIAYADLQSDANGSQRVFSMAISPGHFRTIEVPLLAGRDFNPRDDSGSAAVAIVNQTLAQRFWPGESPIGKHLQAASGAPVEVIGLARDCKYESLQEAPKSFLYRPLAQQYAGTVALLVKTAGEPLAASSLLRSRIAELDANLLAYNLNTLEDRVGLNLLAERAAAAVSGILGSLALALGAIGTYGIMAFLVQQRRREIGIRMALGAQPGDVLRLITRQAMQWTLVGLALGSSAALGLVRLLRRLLYGISPHDPVAFLSVAILLAATAYLACYFPARRASRIDPLDALRHE